MIGIMTMKAEECIFFQLSKASQRGARFVSQKVACLNLTAVQAMVMRFLHDRDEITSAELGVRTDLDSATLTGILDRLESAGLVERLPHPDDRRAILVHLTTKGQETGSQVVKFIEEANTEFVRGLSGEEERTLRSTLTKIRKRAL
jgi:DNA-binding MarR family transcriptional regulator